MKIASVGEFAQFQSFDYARFALSSLETMAHCAADVGRPRALGWPLLKAYYSGFFGAHALLRALGQGVIRLEPSQTNLLTAFGQIQDPSFFAKSGTYHYRLRQNSDRSIGIVLSRLAETGGAHESFWRKFNAYLTEMSNEVALNNEPEASAIISRLAELQALLTRAGSFPGSWLSNVRNQINYQHLLGVWFPYSAAQRDVNYASEIGYQPVSTSRLDYDYRKETIKAFGSGSLFIAALSFELANSLVGAGTRRNTRFARNWQRLTRGTGFA